MFRRKYHIYTVHVNPAAQAPHESAQFVEEGFNVTAFLFSGLWALYHRLWWPVLAILLCNLIIVQLQHEGSISDIGRVILQAGLNLFIGFQANDWLRAKLARRGFVLTDIVSGDSLIRAQQRFFDAYYTPASLTAAP